MRVWRLVIFFSLCSFKVFAQEQMALRINEKGIMKVLQMAIQYNTSTKASRSVVIPGNIYKFTLPKEQFTSNPIVPILNEISDLNLNRDLDFYLNTSDIKISGKVDSQSLRSQIFNSTEKGFDIRLSLNLPEVNVTASSLSLCEDALKGSKSCGSGLKATMTNLKILTRSRPVILSAVLRVRTDGQDARVNIHSVTSNLEGKGSPDLDITFSALNIPRIAIVINGQETELDTSRLKDEILKRKSFFGRKLLAFAAEFIANDVAEMINVYLVNKTIATSYQIYRQDNRPVSFNEFVSQRRELILSDNTYIRSPVIISLEKKDLNPMDLMMEQIAEIIQSAQADVSLKRISTPGNKDIELAGLFNLMLNGRTINVRNTLGNSHRTLPKLDLNSERNHDINLAISEPLINGALDVVNSTKLFQEIFESLSPVPGFSINSVKVHFSGDKALVAVVNAQVDLKKLRSKGMRDWFKNKIAAWLERNNNNSIIYFPIEVSVIPVFKSLASGGTELSLKVLSPFNNTELVNNFNYPSNVPAMTETVKDGVMEELRESLVEHTDKAYNIDLSKFLNQAGVIFLPRKISINQGAYLMLNLDIVDIKFNSKKPTQR